MAWSEEAKQKLTMARALLSDVRYSIVVHEFRCSECDSKRYDSFDMHHMREACQAGISRIDKAINFINKGGDNEPTTTRTNRTNKSRRRK